MEPNIIFAITAVVAVGAAVFVTYRFGPRKRPFIFDLLEAVGEPVRRRTPVRPKTSLGTSDRGSPKRFSRDGGGTVAGRLCKAS